MADSYKTKATMTTDLDFIQQDEPLRSGSQTTGLGTNRALQQLSDSIDSVMNAALFGNVFKAYGGGTISWSTSSQNITFNADVTIHCGALVDGTGITNTLQAASSPISMSAGTQAVCYVVVDRTSLANVTPVVVASPAAFAAVLAANEANAASYIVLFQRNNTVVHTWDGRVIQNGESVTDTGDQTFFAETADLDDAVQRQRDNFQAILHGGGNLSWDLSAQEFTWDSTMYVSLKGNYLYRMTIAPTTLSGIVDGDFVYGTLARGVIDSSSDSAMVLARAGAGAVPNSDDTFIVAKRDGDRLYLWNGTSLGDGDSVLMGSIPVGVQFYAYGTGSGNQEFDITTLRAGASYKVGNNSLQVFRDGVKLRTGPAYWAGGAFPGTGSITGGVLDGNEHYLEYDDGDGYGTKILWVRENGSPTGDETTSGVYHPTAGLNTYTDFPQTTDEVEFQVGFAGQGPSPVESIGISPEPGGGPLEGDVKLEAGSNITITYNGNNIVIAASVAAGVNSLSGLTGNVTLVGGNNVTLGVSAPNITIDCDITNLEDLGDVSTAQSASLRGGYNPSADSQVLTADAGGHIQGFDQVWATEYVSGSLVVRTGGGVLHTNSTSYYSLSTADRIECSTSDMFSGETLDIGWHYLYLGPPSSGTKPAMVVSVTSPDPDGRHPDDADYYFLSSVLVNSSYEFVPFCKSGNWVELLDRQYVIDIPTSTPLGTWVSNQLDGGSIGDVPPGSDVFMMDWMFVSSAVTDTTSQQLKVRLEGSSDVGQYYNSSVEYDTGTDYYHYWDRVRILIDSNRRYELQTDITIGSMRLRGYAEGRRTVGGYRTA